MTAEVVLADNCDDWEGVYVNGKLVVQGNILDAHDVLSYLDSLGVIHYKHRELSSDLYSGYLPENISEVIFK